MDQVVASLTGVTWARIGHLRRTGRYTLTLNPGHVKAELPMGDPSPCYACLLRVQEWHTCSAVIHVVTIAEVDPSKDLPDPLILQEPEGFSVKFFVHRGSPKPWNITLTEEG